MVDDFSAAHAWLCAAAGWSARAATFASHRRLVGAVLPSLSDPAQQRWQAYRPAFRLIPGGASAAIPGGGASAAGGEGGAGAAAEAATPCRPSTASLAWALFMGGLRRDLGLGAAAASQGGTGELGDAPHAMALLPDPGVLGAAFGRHGASAANAAAQEVLSAVRVDGLRLLTAQLVGLARDRASAPSAAMLPQFRADVAAAVAAAVAWVGEGAAGGHIRADDADGSTASAQAAAAAEAVAAASMTAANGLSDSSSCALLACCDRLLSALLLFAGPTADVIAWLRHVREGKVAFAAATRGGRDDRGHSSSSSSSSSSSTEWPFVAAPGCVTLVLARAMAAFAAAAEEAPGGAADDGAAGGAAAGRGGAPFDPLAAYCEQLHLAGAWRMALLQAIPQPRTAGETTCTATRVSWRTALAPCPLSREDALALVRCRYELHAEPYPALEAEELRAADELRDMLFAVTSCES